MPSCVVKWCINQSHRQKKYMGISFHVFPQDEHRRQLWTEAVRLERHENKWTPSKRSCICSVHFKNDDFYTTKKGYTKLNVNSVPICTMVAPENMKKQSISKKQKHQYDPFKEYANVSTDEESQDEKEEITDEAENANVDQSEKLPVVTENVYVNTQIEDRQAKRARIETEDYQLDFTEQLYEFGKFVAEQLMCLDVEDARVAQAEIRELLSKFNTNKVMSCFVETPTIVQSEADKPSNVLTLTHKTKIPAVSAVKKSKPMSAKQTLPKSQLLNTAGPSGTQSGKKKLETLDSSAPSSSFSYVFVSAINAPDLTQSEYGTSNVSSATESSSISFSGISIKAEPEPQSPHSEVSPQIADTESANCSSTPVIKDEPDSYHVDVFQPNIINIQSHIKFEPDSDSDT